MTSKTKHEEMIHSPAKPVSMSQRLGMAQMIAITTILVLITTGFYLFTAAKSEETFHNKVNQTLSYLNGTLAPMLWHVDYDTASLVSEAALREDLVIGILVIDELGKSVISKQKQNEVIGLRQKQAIYFKDIKVGDIEVHFSRATLDETLTDILWICLMVWLSTVISIILLNNIFIRKFFRGPLASFSRLAKDYRQHPESPPLTTTHFLEFQLIENVVKELANDVFRQLQELQESEAYYRSLFENALYGIAITGPDFEFVKVNDAWCKLIGYTKGELLDNMSVLDVTMPDQIPESMELMKKLNSREVKQSRLEKRYKTKSGDIIDAITFVKGIYDDQGRYLGNAASILDITKRKQGEEQLQYAYNRLQDLTRRLETAKEEERTRIARELHDEFGQCLSSLKWDLACLRRELQGQANLENADNLENRIQSMSELLLQTIHTTRRIATSLRPALLDDLGLVPALEWLVRDFQDRTGIACTLSIEPKTIPDSFNPENSTALFRITQELLTNILRHANATQILISMRMGEEFLVLEVQDNGIGFTEHLYSSQGSLGLLGIRERSQALGGNFTIQGDSGKGTLAVIQIPAIKDSLIDSQVRHS